MEVQERSLSALFCTVHRLALFLVNLAQITFFATSYNITTIAYLFSVSLKPFSQEIIRRNTHIAIHEKQPFVLGLLSQEVTNSSSAHILFPANIMNIF